jgi:YD repeat-containing protein
VNHLARCDWVEDRNGNKLTISYPDGFHVIYTDQLGRTTTLQWDDPLGTRLTDPDNPGVILAVLVTLPAAGGGVHYYKIKTDVMNANYRGDIDPALPVFNGNSEFTSVGTALFTGGTDAGLDYIDGKPVLTQLILPDNRALTFKYNEYGEVAEVQLPTGGKVQYDYQAVLLDTTTGAGLPVGNTLVPEAVAPGGGNVRAVDRAVITRRTYPDGSTLEGTWTYIYKAQQNGALTTGDTEVKCSSGGQTLLDEFHFFKAAQRFVTSVSGGGVDGTGYSLWSTGLERRTERRGSNGITVVGASEQDWSQRAAVSWSGSYATQQIANDNRVDEERRILDDGSTSRSHTMYDQFNNPTRVDEYDFDDSLKRYTTTSYIAGSPYWGSGVNSRNMVRVPAQQSVFDGSTSGELARTTYEYDNYTADANNNNQLLTSYTDFASIPGHTSSYDENFTVRGNLTRVTRRVSSSLSLDSYTRYDVLGNVVSVKDPKGKVATIDYLDDFGTGSSPGSNTAGHSTYSLPTKIESPPPNQGESKHTAYSQYDFSTGLLTGFKDRNGIITQNIYNDPFDRPKQIIAAVGTSAENHTAIYYAPAVVFGVNLTNNDALTAKDQAGIDDGNLRSWTKTDGFGRTFESWTHAPQELDQGNPVSGDIVVKANYDGMGRTRQTSNPFRPALSTESAQYTTTEYDRAGRVITVTTPDNAVVSTAYDGPRVLVKDQAGKERLSKTDGLGRLTDVWEVTASDSATEAINLPESS